MRGWCRRRLSTPPWKWSIQCRPPRRSSSSRRLPHLDHLADALDPCSQRFLAIVAVVEEVGLDVEGGNACGFFDLTSTHLVHLAEPAVVVEKAHEKSVRRRPVDLLYPGLHFDVATHSEDHAQPLLGDILVQVGSAGRDQLL